MGQKQKIQVTKASGENAEFDAGKLRSSLLRAGADEQTIRSILTEVEKTLYEGITTRKIYQKAYSLLRRSPGPQAAKYKLKKAILELGPSGYPFEKFIGSILEFQGYRVKVGTLVNGHCVNHEVDVIAEKDHEFAMVECKFHGNQGNKCDVKIPLYIYARFKDLEKNWLKMNDHRNLQHSGWVVTNTRFTSEAIQYGNCMGLHLMGWDYPKSGSLKERIDLSGLHPITCLTTLKKSEIRSLLDQKIVLCKELAVNNELLYRLSIPPRRIPAILKEIDSLCNE